MIKSVYEYGKRRKEEGLKEVIKEGIKEIAINMIKNGENTEKIKLYTKLTTKEIEKLKLN